MRAALLFILTVFTTFVSAQQPLVPPITDPKQILSKSNPDLQNFSIERLAMTRFVGPSTWSPDGTEIAFISNLSGRENIWIASAEGGFPVQLTISEQRQTAPAWSPDGKWIAFVSDTNGDEVFDLFLVSPRTGQVVNLTKTPNVSEGGPAWSPDGRWLAYKVKPRASSSSEIDAVNVLTKAVKHLSSGTPKGLDNSHPIWSRDGKWIAFTRGDVAGRNSSVAVVEVATGKTTELTSHTGEQKFVANDWSLDGKTLLITSDARNGYDNVALLDVATKQLAWLTEEKWELHAGGFSPDGKSLTWTANVDGSAEIHVYDLGAKSAERLPLPKGVDELAGAESAFSRDGSHLLFYNSAPTSPNDLWFYDIAAKNAHQITKSVIAGLRAGDLVEPVLVHYPTRDGKFQISAFVYVPYNQQRDYRRPAIMYLHDESSAKMQSAFSPVIQYLVNQGYFVIAPVDRGGAELQDVLGAAEWIKQSPYIDPKKLVVMGSGYGGYLTMMALAKTPESWAAGIAVMPFANRFGQNDSTARPLDFVDRIKAPLLLLAGGTDPSSSRTEAEQIAKVAKQRGGVVDLMIYANEGRAFARAEDFADAFKRVAAFLKEHVPAPGCGCSVYE